MRKRFSIALLTLLALSSCANWYTPRTPMPIAEVVTLSKSGASTEQVIRRIRDSGTTYALRGSDFAKLKADGVPDPVLDFLQQSLVNDLDFLTRYWDLGGGLGACKFCYPQPVDVDKLESGFGVVPATPPGQYQTDKPTGAPDWLPPLLSPPTGAPVSISDVVKMSKDGVPEAQIVERIRTSRLEGVFGHARRGRREQPRVVRLRGDLLQLLELDLPAPRDLQRLEEGSEPRHDGDDDEHQRHGIDRQNGKDHVHQGDGQRSQRDPASQACDIHAHTIAGGRLIA